MPARPEAPAPAPLHARPSDSRLALGLGTSWLAVSSSAVVIVLAAPVPALGIAAIRVALTSLVWTAIALAKRVRGPSAEGAALEGERAPSLPWARIVLSGVLLGGHFGLWVASLFLTSVPHAAILVGLQPLFAGLFGRLLGDRATWRLPVGVAVALVGTRLMTEADAEGVTLMGDAFAILAAACSAAYLTVNRGISSKVSLPLLLALVNAAASLTLWAAIFVFGGGVWWDSGAGFHELLALLWLGIGPGFVGHGLMNWAARTVPVHVVSMVILLEPIGAAVLAWIVLSQGVTPMEVAGALFLLLGAGLTLLDAE